MTEPVPKYPGQSSRPEDFLLPIRTRQRTGSAEPEMVEFWEWVPAIAGTRPGFWARVLWVYE